MNQVAAITHSPLHDRPAPAVRRPSAAPTITAAETNTHLDVILRAARDPSVDIGKMKDLIALHREMMLDEARRSFIRAKIAMRPQLPKVEKLGQIIITDKNDRNKVIQSTAFARFEDIHDAAFPVLIEYGFDLDYRTGTRDGRVVVTAVLSHADGHREETSLDGPLDTSGSKNNIQGVGSTLSYLKRYTMCSILNIRTADKGEFDDDGLAAGRQEGPQVISGEQVAQIRKEMAERGVDEVKFCDFAGVESLETVEASGFEGALAKVRMKRKLGEARHGA